MELDDARLPRGWAIFGRYPAVAVMPIAWLWILAGPIQLVAYLVSVALLATAVGWEIVRRRWGWCGPCARLARALLFLAAIGVLRQAGGGLASGVGIVALVPILQTALFGRDRRELWVTLVAVAALYLVPILVVGGAAYPPTQYRAGVLAVAVGCAIGLATQGLVSRVRREADAAHESRAMLAQVSEVVHELFSSQDVRADLSAGVLRVAGASTAILFEPDRQAGVLRSSAATGRELPSTVVALDRGNPIGAALLGGRPSLIESVVESELAAPDLWRACGRPDVVLYQPLVRRGESIGVVAVAWAAGGTDVAARATVVGLLAHEAAVVLDRADHVTLLTDMAETDPLTGLANRRAWDERVAQALHEGRDITVALLDIDHFKRFNDSHGHLAGDRLLRDTAAAWTDLLRGGDLLARLGGEEFGLLLLDCEQGGALDVTERLLRAMADGQTCSAGLAQRRPGEPFESVLGRADRALYEAKAAGRDLALTAA